MSAVLITGYPGVVADQLLGRLVRERAAGTRFFLAVQPHSVFAAQARCAAIERVVPHFVGHWHIVESDVRVAGLGMPLRAQRLVCDQVQEVWHLAARCDFRASSRELYEVNVDGTGHVLGLCERLRNLRALHYMSSHLVFGDATGRVYEDELDVGQGFDNAYQSTRFWSERAVRARMGDQPIVVHRASHIVPNEPPAAGSPYDLVWRLQQGPRLARLSRLLRHTAPLHIVPMQHVIDSMISLSTNASAIGHTVHLVDPDPLTGTQVVAQRLPRSSVRALAALSAAAGRSPAGFGRAIHLDCSVAAKLLQAHVAPCARALDHLPERLLPRSAPQLHEVHP